MNQPTAGSVTRRILNGELTTSLTTHELNEQNWPAAQLTAAFIMACMEMNHRTEDAKTAQTDIVDLRQKSQQFNDPPVLFELHRWDPDMLRELLLEIWRDPLSLVHDGHVLVDSRELLFASGWPI